LYKQNFIFGYLLLIDASVYLIGQVGKMWLQKVTAGCYKM